MIYMLTIYCKKCGKDVKVTRNCICPHCKKDWTDEVSKEIDIDEVFDDLMDEESEELISNYLVLSSTTKYIAVIMIVILLIINVTLCIEEELSFIMSFVNGFFIGFFVVYIFSLIIAHFKWKAYMLNYIKNKK